MALDTLARARHAGVAAGVALLLPLFVTGAHAAACDDYTNYIHAVSFVPTEANIKCMAVRDDVLFACFSDSMTTVSLANPARPIRLASVVLRNDPVGIAVQGNYAYIAGQSPSLAMEVLDVTDAAAPTRVNGAYQVLRFVPAAIAANAMRVVVVGDSLQAFDISNPIYPQSTWRRGTDGGRSTHIGIESGKAYILSLAKLRLIEVVEPGNEESYDVLLGSALSVSASAVHVAGFQGLYRLEGAGLVHVHVDEFGQSFEALLPGSHIISCDVTSIGTFLQVIDPDAPAMLGGMKLPGESDTHVPVLVRLGEAVCVGTNTGIVTIQTASENTSPGFIPSAPPAASFQPLSIAAAYTKIAVVGSRGVASIQIYDGELIPPALRGPYVDLHSPSPTGSSRAVAFLQPNVCAVAEGEGVELFSLTGSQGEPVQLAWVPVEGGGVTSVIAGRRYVYARSGGTLSIIDALTPSAAQVVDTLLTESDHGSIRQSMFLDGAHLCLAAGSGFDYQLHVFATSGEAKPQRLRVIPLGQFGDVNAVAGSHGLAFVCSNFPSPAVRVFRLSTGEDVQFLPIPDQPLGIAAVGTSVYVHGANNIWVLELTDDQVRFAGSLHVPPRSRAAWPIDADCSGFWIANENTLCFCAPRCTQADECKDAVEVQSLEAWFNAGATVVSWTLTNDATNALVAVHVERADYKEGPYATVTSSLLVPSRSMRWVDPSPLTGFTEGPWYRLRLETRTGEVELAGPVALQHTAAATRVGLAGVRESRDGRSVEFDLDIPARTSRVALRIFDVRGRALWTQAIPASTAGRCQVVWFRQDLSGASVRRGLFVVSVLVDGAQVGRRKVVLRQ